ncbi:DUF5682 family protein [Streptacidiphilus fuscans]|uniref:Uncharacterized protein n=1 Tax=Streptacidiphilus fuscans TaxID=2789292 RepID=A0A931FD60_9ACTN|nr:DUF5682 family protein [Streptacidiphilus fuscans]MBF9067835.1 hypothetical protein [Streptacidiphilus fuscans]
MTETALLGVRHHGPGSALAVGAALAQFRPDIVLIEGPPEADALLPLAASKEMTPPVALLAHVVEQPSRAAFWPYAAFSPEWVALRHALDGGVPVRFVDLPAAHMLALATSDDEGEKDERGEKEKHEQGRQGEQRANPAPHLDPIGELARAAGQEDAERWWDDVVEHTHPAGAGGSTDANPDAADALAPFRALADAMGELRTGVPVTPGDARREAYMRKQIRAAAKAGHARIAVVCGAWHVPALAPKVSTSAADNALLRGLPKLKVELTWVPWTHRRLSQATGYGAGIASPGWYQHLFEANGRQVVERWLTKVAVLLREEDHAVSSAHVIEAVRLAETLAAMRGRPLAGLAETVDAVRAVLCDGSDVPLRLIEDRLVVGDALGEVPEGAPAVPLQRDLTRLQRELRLRPEARVRSLDLDLRRELDAARSRLFHRLTLLGIDWAVPARSQVRSTGTFRESWELSWEPELAVKVAEVGVWGTTVEAAASARASARALEAGRLGEVTALAESCLLAALPEALPVVLRCLADRAALDSDVEHLADALPALVRSLRYGDVRATGAGLLSELATSLAVRICVGLPAAATSLEPAAAAALADRIAATHSAIGLLATTLASTRTETQPAEPGAERTGPDVLEQWVACLRSLVRRELAAGVVRGRATRLLLDDGRLAEDETARLLGLVLTPGVPPAEGAAWVDGFLAGGGMLLVHDQRLLALLDAWIAAIPADVFPDVLPLLRRTFSRLESGVRRSVGELVRDGMSGRDRPTDAPLGFAAGFDAERAAPALATVQLILGTGETK